MASLLTATYPGVRCFDVLGCKVHAVTAPTLTDLADVAAGLRASSIIANHNLHSLYLYQRDAKLREFYAKADWIHVDGMGVVLLGWMTGVKLRRSERVTYVDWLPLLIERAAKRNWRVFYLGSKPGVAEKGVAILKEKYPGLEMRAKHGYFDPSSAENETILYEIEAFSPDVVMVGMGMPRQEHWILDNRERLGSAVLLPCGASIDYVAGEIPTPPRWAGRCGLEWLYRLSADPGRLWKRYLIEPWMICNLLRAHWFQSQ